jgi:hypothetical protein
MTELERWHGRLADALGALADLPAVLTAPPGGGAPQERLRLLAAQQRNEDRVLAALAEALAPAAQVAREEDHD